MVILRRFTRRKLTFVNVSKEFTATPKQLSKYNPQSCYGHYLGYRLMCRFATAPVYWMKEFDQYEYVIRIDEDAKFTAPFPTDLVSNMKEHGSVYGYAIEVDDVSICRIGLNDFISKFINEINHEEFGRPWIRLSNHGYTFSLGNPTDVINLSNTTKRPLITNGLEDSLKFDPNYLMQAVVTGLVSFSSFFSIETSNLNSCTTAILKLSNWIFLSIPIIVNISTTSKMRACFSALALGITKPKLRIWGYSQVRLR